MSSNVSFLMDLDKGGSSAPLQDAHIQLEEGWMGLRLSSRTRNVYIEEIENLVRGYDSRCLRVWQDKLKKVSSYLISIRETALNEFLKKIPGNETDRLQMIGFITGQKVCGHIVSVNFVEPDHFIRKSYDIPLRQQTSSGAASFGQERPGGSKRMRTSL